MAEETLTLQYTQAFPNLTDSELDCIETLGMRRSVAPGETLIQSGQRDYSFFAIRRGLVAIIDRSSGKDREITVHGAGAFTGDVDMLTGRSAVISAVAQTEAEVIEVSADRVRALLGDVPDLSDKLLLAFQLRREQLEGSDYVGLRLVGPMESKETNRLREFLYKNKVMHTFVDAQSESGTALLSELDATVGETPLIVSNGAVEKRPSLAAVAACLGISRVIGDEVYDVLIIGAGPAGLAAAVYGASEGLKTLVVDRMGPGGQAGQSSKIENYMGFPSGLSGADLANRGYLQALKFGAHFTAPVTVESLSTERVGEEEIHLADLCTGQSVAARTVLIATGASYRRIPIEGSDHLEGSGIYYSATSVEARICRGATAVVVGGGNSAGQAAMYLARQASEVKMVLRGSDLRKSMSSYLAHRIENSGVIEVLLESEVTEVSGKGRLESVTLTSRNSGESRGFDASGLFVFIGAQPHTEWLPGKVALDRHGFVLTGQAAEAASDWPLDRRACELETTVPGVFAVGDVRSGTTKRCAFATGDGALGITCVHQLLSARV